MSESIKEIIEQIQREVQETIGEGQHARYFNEEYMGQDLFGYSYNKKYPPNKALFPNYDGYETPAQAAFFYDFTIQGYDIRFKYAGKPYYCLNEQDYVARCDEHFTVEYEVFRNGNDLIENMEIDGHKLIDIIDELEDVEPV